MRQLKNLGKAKIAVSAGPLRAEGGVGWLEHLLPGEASRTPGTPEQNNDGQRAGKSTSRPGKGEPSCAWAHSVLDARLSYRKSKATRAGTVRRHSRNHGFSVSRRLSRRTRGGLRAPGPSRLRVQHVAQPHSHPPAAWRRHPHRDPASAEGSPLRKSAQNHDCWGLLMVTGDTSLGVRSPEDTGQSPLSQWAPAPALELPGERNGLVPGMGLTSTSKRSFYLGLNHLE